MEYKVHILDLLYKGNKRGIAAFLVETKEGPIMVETGPHSTLSTLKKEIKRVGYKFEDIKHVLLTHIHLDHAGAAWCFAQHGARIYLHPFGYKHMHDPSRLLASAKMIYKDEMDMLWGTLKPIQSNQLFVVNDLDNLTVNGLNFRAWHTPGHAKHHIAWQLGSDLFTGDVAGVCIHDGPVIPPCPPPDIDIELWLESIERISTIEEVSAYYLTHFGRVTNLAEHRDKLKKILKRYAAFFLPFHRAGRSADEILPQFRAFVREYLVEEGMQRGDAGAYEAANPPDMSAVGLMRYWKKRDEREMKKIP